jgi:hypothetical protein
VTRLPDHTKPTAPQAGQPTPDTLHRAAQIAAAVDAVYEQPTQVRVDDDSIPSYKDGPRIGTTPPVDQPGRPSMSRTATNISGVLIASSAPIFALGAAATGVLWSSGQADPTVIGWICAGVVALPVALTVPVLAVKGLMKSAKETVQAAPPVIHQHYNGNITQDQRQVHTKTIAVLANTRTQLPK